MLVTTMSGPYYTGVVLQKELVLASYEGTCVCVYMVTSGVTVWVSIVSGVWSDSE